MVARLLVAIMLAIGVVLAMACEAQRIERRPEQSLSMVPPAPEPAPSDEATWYDENIKDMTPKPYDGWERWCGPIDRQECEVVDDCEGELPAGEWRCVRPWWAKAEMGKIRICAPTFPNRKEKAVVIDQLRNFVAHRCGRGCDRKALLKFLRLAALRDSSYRPWKRHRLNPDVEANKNAWVRQSPRYADNDHYDEKNRWEAGLGLYGQNAALWTRVWDAAAPPEILCRVEESTEAYLRGARGYWGRLDERRRRDMSADCDGDGEREELGAVTWYDINRAVSTGGRPCPTDENRADYEARAKRQGLDSDQEVTKAMLGKPIPRARQNEDAERIRRKSKSPGE